MESNEAKTLPPLVYGKLAGVLEFFIDEVKITENFNFESNVCDIVVQIQWWGENFPSYIRPLRISYFSKRNEPILDAKIRLHSLTYEVKTDVELFKSYLKSIEVMELAVYDKIENAIIGSAFAKDLISIIFNNKIVIIPIINYFGNRIGELKLRLSFHNFNQDSVISRSENLHSTYFPTEDLKINLSEIHTSRRAELKEKDNLNELHQSITNNIQKQLQSLDISDSECCIRSIHYNTPVSCHQGNTNHLKISHKKDLDIPCREKIRNTCSDIKDQSYSPPEVQSKDSVKVLYSEKFKRNCSDLKKQTCSSPPHLPSKEMYDDSSKVLYFNIRQNKKLSQPKKIVSRPKSAKQGDLKKEKLNKLSSKLGCEKIEATKPLVIEFKPPQKEKKNPEKKIIHKVKKKEDLKSIQKVSEEISRINKIVMPSNNSNTTSPGFSDLEKIPVKEFKKLPNSKVLNYLLGKEMSKRDELLALHEFKNMSPCQNMVSSITDLCSNDAKTKCCKNRKVQVNEKLQFNLNDPVEKLYYKTFFSNNEEFEVAELLNRPENKFILDRRKCNEKMIKDTKKIQTDISGAEIFNSKKNSPLRKNCDIEPCKNFEVHLSNNLEPSCCGNKARFDCEFVRNCHKEMGEMPRSSNCLRCKYYKKLGELDKIIESLKVFEKRMVTIEKESKLPSNNEYNLEPVRENCLVDYSPTSSLTELDLNGIDDDMQSISSEVNIERRNLLDDYDDDLEESLDDSDFIEFSDYLARSRIHNMG